MLLHSAKRILFKSRAFIPGLRSQHRREAMVGPLGHWNALRHYQITALKMNGLQPHHRVLDLGCGPLQGGIAMIEHLEDSRYFGVDIHPANLAEGYRQVADHGLVQKNPRLFHSVDFGVEHLDGLKFDFIWASQILYYFDMSVLRRLMRLLAERLAPEGKFLGDILGPCDPEFQSRRHLAWCRSVKNHSVALFNELAQDCGLAARALGRIDAFGYPTSLNLRSNILIEVSRAPVRKAANGSRRRPLDTDPGLPTINGHRTNGHDLLPSLVSRQTEACGASDNT